MAWLSRRGAPEHGDGKLPQRQLQGFPPVCAELPAEEAGHRRPRQPHGLGLPSLVWPWLLCPRLSQLTPYAFQCPAPLVGLWDMDPGPGPSLQMPSAGPSEAV